MDTEKGSIPMVAVIVGEGSASMSKITLDRGTAERLAACVGALQSMQEKIAEARAGKEISTEGFGGYVSACLSIVKAVIMEARTPGRQVYEKADISYRGMHIKETCEAVMAFVKEESTSQHARSPEAPALQLRG